MRRAMRKARRDGGLPGRALRSGDAGSLSAERAPAVCTDDELRGKLFTIVECELCQAGLQFDAFDRARPQRETRRGPAVEAVEQRAVGDVVAEGGQAELARLERHVGGPDQALGS